MGFFKHGWLIDKWIVSVGIIVWGTVHLGPMATGIMETMQRLHLDALKDAEYLGHWRIGFWAGISNAALLFVAIVVSTWKPWKNLRKKTDSRSSPPPRSGL